MAGFVLDKNNCNFSDILHLLQRRERAAGQAEGEGRRLT